LSTTQLLLDFAPPAPTLGNFAAGRNAEALSALHTLLDGSLRERCIFLWGAPGCGKSHLLRAAADARHAHAGSSAYAPAVEVEALEAMPRLPGLVALDDVERTNATQQVALFRLFQRLTEDDTRLLVSAAAAPAATALRDDLRTRLASGLTFQIHVLSDDEKVEALRKHAAGRSFDLAPEIAQYLLRRRSRDLPSLMAVLDAIDQYSLRTQRPITLALLREMLQPEQMSGS
jgi:DnaA family protein